MKCQLRITFCTFEIGTAFCQTCDAGVIQLLCSWSRTGGVSITQRNLPLLLPENLVGISYLHVLQLASFLSHLKTARKDDSCHTII